MHVKQCIRYSTRAGAQFPACTRVWWVHRVHYMYDYYCHCITTLIVAKHALSLCHGVFCILPRGCCSAMACVDPTVRNVCLCSEGADAGAGVTSAAVIRCRLALGITVSAGVPNCLCRTDAGTGADDDVDD